MNVSMLSKAVQVLLALVEAAQVQLHNNHCNKLQWHQRAKAQLGANSLCTYSLEGHTE